MCWVVTVELLSLVDLYGAGLSVAEEKGRSMKRWKKKCSKS